MVVEGGGWWCTLQSILLITPVQVETDTTLRDRPLE